MKKSKNFWQILDDFIFLVGMLFFSTIIIVFLDSKNKPRDYVTIPNEFYYSPVEVDGTLYVMLPPITINSHRNDRKTVDN